MGRVIHFEIPADDPERAINFYSKSFDWKINSWGGPEDYWLIETGDPEEPGIDGAITKRATMVTTVTNTIDVLSLEDAMKAVKENGGQVVTEKMTVPFVGYMAYCRDTEGNLFGIMQSDPSAK